MSIRIEDAKGRGNLAEVTNNKKLRTYTTVESEASFESEANGVCFAWTASYNYTADDTVLLIKNTNTNLDIIIENIIFQSDTSTQVIVHYPATVATPTGTAITGVNMNKTSGKTARATAIQDETTNARGDVISRIFVKGGEDSLFIPYQGMPIIGLNDSIAIDYVTEGGSCFVTIIGYFHKQDE